MCIRDSLTLALRKPKPDLGFKTFLAEEIATQPRQVAALINEADLINLAELENFREEILAVQNLLVIGSNQTMHVGQALAPIFKKFGCFETVNVVAASELAPEDIPKMNGGVVLLPSFSGSDSYEQRASELVSQMNVFSIGITNDIAFIMEGRAKCGLFVPSGREVGKIETTSRNAQAVTLMLLAHYVAQNRGIHAAAAELKTILNSLPALLEASLAASQDVISAIAPAVAKETRISFVAKGSNYGMAQSMANSWMSLTGIHVDAVRTNLTKDELAPIPTSVLLITEDQHMIGMLEILEQNIARGALPIVVTNCAQSIPKIQGLPVISIPAGGPTDFVLAAAPLQLLALKVAQHLGRPTDKAMFLPKF
eukprot:TRINITY_DN12148_c0_g1_i4.p1 TRINITY_DN12148_c0_g1~~TRINITY_DN12148_c0_g1_i4.p1  ORF type:complete len:368 (+),score=111.82 TRINITY_DN12148_c0_g1_i4:64-1167(+)